MIIGVATFGGDLSPAWYELICQALVGGMDVACGLHQRLNDIPQLLACAQQHDRRLIDVRVPPEKLIIGTGKSRGGQRVLTVGTDCSIGKMFTSLAITHEMQSRGLDATFCATGQTGIFIQGAGVALDAIPADFIAGSIEDLAPHADDAHWDIIEGQGSLFHPAFAGVSLGLLHGAQAQHLIMCYEPREHMRSLPDFPSIDLVRCIALNEQCARLTSPQARVVGIACNTSKMDAGGAKTLLDSLAQDHNIPAVDPLRDGVGLIVDAICG